MNLWASPALAAQPAEQASPDADRKGEASGDDEAQLPPPEPPPSKPPSESEPEGSPAPKKADVERALIARNYTGFHLGIDPGVVIGADGKAGFSLGVRLEYGFDTGSLIVAPGVSLAAYFLSPNVYVGMPTVRLVLPIRWFVPFVEGGAGVAQISDPSQTKPALLGAGGFMIHASPNFAIGVEAGYEAILGTDFGVIILSPVFALSF